MAVWKRESLLVDRDSAAGAQNPIIIILNNLFVEAFRGYDIIIMIIKQQHHHHRLLVAPLSGVHQCSISAYHLNGGLIVIVSIVISVVISILTLISIIISIII